MSKFYSYQDENTNSVFFSSSLWLPSPFGLDMENVMLLQWEISVITFLCSTLSR